MTPTQRDDAHQNGSDSRRRGTRWHHVRYTALAAATVIVALAACEDHVVPYFTAPTSVPNSPTGIKQAVLGLFSYTRNDQSTNRARELIVRARGREFHEHRPAFDRVRPGYQADSRRGLVIDVGARVRKHSRGARDPGGAAQYEPRLFAAQFAGLAGVVQTIEALNYLIVVWAHDSLGVAIMQSPNATIPAAAVCLKDGLQYIVALLDSGNTALNTAGATPFPFALPPGFAAVGAVAGPSTVAGSFASFNRALAAKAGLELAYAIAHQSGAAPDTINPGSPECQRADTRRQRSDRLGALQSGCALSKSNRTVDVRQVQCVL